MPSGLAKSHMVLRGDLQEKENLFPTNMSLFSDEPLTEAEMAPCKRSGSKISGYEF